MQVSETLNEGLKRGLDIVVPAAEINGKFEAKLMELKGQANLKGFRKGKVPITYLRRLYGKSIMGEIIQEELNQATQSAIAERSEKPAMRPEISLPEDGKKAEQIMSGKADLAYKVSYEIVPAIKELDYSKVSIERPLAEAMEEEIETRLQEVGESNRPYESKTSAAEEKDRVTISYLGKIKGEPFEGGQDDNAMLILGSGQFVPGFEEQLIGLKAGEEKIVKITFPENYPATALQGQEAEFEVTVRDVAAPSELVIDDDFAKRLGLESLEKLREAIKQQIENQYTALTRQKVKRQLLDQLDEFYTFELPSSLLEQEFENIWRQVTRDMEQHGKSFEEEGTTEEKAKQEYRAIAERRVRLGLVLAEIGEKNRIEVTEEELQKALAERIRQFPGQEQQAYDYYRANPDAVASLRAPIFEDKVVDYLLELVKVTDKKVSKEELMASEDEEQND